MSRFVGRPLAAVFAAIIAIVGLAPATLFAGPMEQKAVSGPDIVPFQSAQFDLNGFFKVDGITVDVTGQGSLAPPDKSAGTYKIGPLSLETITANNTFYARSKFDPKWEEQEIPPEVPLNVGPIVLSDVLPKGPYSVQGQERVDGKLTTKWSTQLDLGLLLALSELSPDDDQTVRDALKSLKGNLEVWVGNDDSQLYKERVVFTFTVPAIEPGGDSLPGTIDMTIQYSKHNQPVAIQAPVTDRSVRRPGLTFPKIQSLVKSLEGEFTEGASRS